MRVVWKLRLVGVGVGGSMLMGRSVDGMGMRVDFGTRSGRRIGKCKGYL